MGYIALRRMTTVRGLRNNGDPVPEAEEWKNVRAYLGAGHLKWVPDSEMPPDPLAMTEPEPEPEPKRRGKAAADDADADGVGI